MATDVKLDQVDGTYVVIEGRVVKVESSDFMLDSAERHTGGGTHRRALVHDQGDGLTINFSGDYPGGVTINDVAGIVPRRPDDLRPPFIPNLVIHGGISYETQGMNMVDGRYIRVPVILTEVLSELQEQISVLKGKVEALEARL